MFFRPLFVANGFALREQGISRVNDAGVAADEAAYVEKRNNARKSAVSEAPALLLPTATALGGANIALLQRVDRHGRGRMSCLPR